MKLLEIVHPAAKSLVDISLSQDSEVGDGTTTVVLLAGEFLKEAKPFIEDGVHPRNIIKAFRQAALMAANHVKELSVSIAAKVGGRSGPTASMMPFASPSAGLCADPDEPVPFRMSTSATSCCASAPPPASTPSL